MKARIYIPSYYGASITISDLPRNRNKIEELTIWVGTTGRSSPAAKGKAKFDTVRRIIVPAIVKAINATQQPVTPKRKK